VIWCGTRNDGDNQLREGAAGGRIISLAHNLFGTKMAFVGEVPWHQLGEAVPPNVTSGAMLKAAHLDWTVEKVPATGARIIKRRRGNDIYDRYFIERACVREERVPPVLGIVGAQYELLQNHEAFAFFDPFLKPGQARYETAGALGNGERVWVQVRVGDPMLVTADDQVDKFVLLSNSHDGRGALSLRFTPTRVVCQNTLNLALEGGEHVVNLRHSRHMRDRLADQQVEFLLGVVGETFNRAAEQFKKLAATSATDDLRNKFLTMLFPKTKEQEKRGEKPRWWKAIDEVLDNIIVTPPQTRHTMWGLYNAVTHAEDYRDTTEALPESRLERVWFGRGAEKKIKALETAVALCQA
jgi:phage/plasmid-like protein (TIGR03299 family)